MFGTCEKLLKSSELYLKKELKIHNFSTKFLTDLDNALHIKRSFGSCWFTNGRKTVINK